jgi:hypothetical protein
MESFSKTDIRPSSGTDKLHVPFRIAHMAVVCMYHTVRIRHSYCHWNSLAN